MNIFFLQSMPKRGEGKKGFTLIELLTVVAIIAVLTAVVMVNFQQVRRKGRDTKRIADIKNIQLSLQQFYDRCRTYPASLSPTDTGGGMCPTGITFGIFMNKVPLPPANSVDANYNYSAYTRSTGNYPYSNYHIGASLEDSKNPYLLEDADFTSRNITGWSTGFVGTDPVYDLISR